MKKKIVLLSLILMIFLFACSTKSTNELDKDIKNIDFEVSKSQLAKSFSRLKPYAEIKDKEFNPEKETIDLAISLGLTESSGLSIDKIIKDKDTLNIYVTSKFDQNELELAVPQAIVKLDAKHIKDDLNLLELNIINDNYKPISLKLNLNDAVSKINSHFKLSSSVTPKVDLIKEDGEYIWDVEYKYIFDKEDADLPLISFNSQVNANTGSIIKGERKPISKPIDYGSILNFADKNSIIYKKTLLDKKTQNTTEELWTYNLSTEDMNNLFISNHDIISSQFNPNLDCISFIEMSRDNSDLFLVSKDSKNATKISFDDNINPDIANWIDNDNLCVVEKFEDKSRLYQYNVPNDELKLITDIPMDIYGLIFMEDKFLFTENQGDEINKQIYISKEKDNFQKVGQGFQPRFINDDVIVYLEDVDGTDNNLLHFYSIKNKNQINKISDNIQSFQIIEKNMLVFISKQDRRNNYNVYLYDFKNDKIQLLSQSLSNKAFYSSIRNKLYLNINSPVEDDINQLIYPINLNK